MMRLRSLMLGVARLVVPGALVPGALALGSGAAAQEGPTGACCYTNSACVESTEAYCNETHGSYQGDGVECAGASCPCAADVDDDGGVDLSDLLDLLASWGPCPDCPADIDGDDVVGIFDLLEILFAWGPCAPVTGAVVEIDPPVVILEDVSDLVASPAGLTTWRVSAVFGGADTVLAVLAQPSLGTVIRFETDDPEGLVNACLIESFDDYPTDPPICEPYDSWITIGSPDTHDTQKTPGFLGGMTRVIEGVAFEETDGGWYDGNPTTPETGPKVALAQFTVRDGFRVRLEGAIAWRPEGLPGGRVTTAFDAPAIGFDPPVVIPAAGAPSIEATGDLDGDGTEDLVVAIPALGAVQVFLNTGNDEKGAWLGYDRIDPPTSVGANPRGVAVGLFDGDEHLDVVVTNNLDNDVSILINDGLGAGTFEPPLDIGVGEQPFGVAVADIVGGASLDVVVVNRTTGPNGTVTILRGDGAGGFAFEQELLAGQAPSTVCPRDLDNEKGVEAELELIIGNEGDDTVWVYRRKNGEFLDPLMLEVGAAPVDLTLGDFDGNGFVDIASADFADSTVSVLLNRGDDVFDARVALAVGVGPQSVDAVDLDGDGKPDLAVVVNDPEAVQALQNASAEQLGFNDPLSFHVGAKADPNFVASADVNGDGRFDLVTVNTVGEDQGSVSVLVNASPLALAPGDVDADGDVDFADLLRVLAAWGPCPDCPEDLDGDGEVTFGDVLIVLSNWTT